jgi:hypothetical protein
MKIRNLPLIVGILIPILFITIISVVIFAPSLSIKPQHNFVYISDYEYYSYPEGYLNSYKVENNRIILDPNPSYPERDKLVQKKVAPPLYLYDVKTDSSHLIDTQDIQNYLVDPGPSSPDGYNVAFEYMSDGIFGLFGSSGESSGFFISKDGGKKKLNGISGYRCCSTGNFKLIGWVK